MFSVWTVTVRVAWLCSLLVIFMIVTVISLRIMSHTEWLILLQYAPFFASIGQTFQSFHVICPVKYIKIDNLSKKKRNLKKTINLFVCAFYSALVSLLHSHANTLKKNQSMFNISFVQSLTHYSSFPSECLIAFVSNVNKHNVLTDVKQVTIHVQLLCV